MILSKGQVLAVFGNGTKLGNALGLGRSAISQWPKKLSQRQTDVVIGAAFRLGIPIENFYPEQQGNTSQTI